MKITLSYARLNKRHPGYVAPYFKYADYSTKEEPKVQNEKQSSVDQGKKTPPSGDTTVEIQSRKQSQENTPASTGSEEVSTF